MFVLVTAAYLALLTTSEQALTCLSSNGMTNELRKVFVDQHNKYRLPGVSLQIRYSAEMLQRQLGCLKWYSFMLCSLNLIIYAVRTLHVVEYDCSIENKMVAWLRQCTWGHSPKTNRPGLGENLWMVSPIGRNKTESIIRAVADWFAELKEKGVPTANKFTVDVFNRGVGHYTQLVWEKSDRIGCGIQDCPSSRMTYVGCEYKPGGNMLNDYIYKVGNPCTKNEDCECNNCTCSTAEGLCIRPDSTPMPGEMNSLFQQEKHNRFTLPHSNGWMNSQNQKDDRFSLPLGFGRLNSQNQQQKDDWFSQPLGFSRMNSRNQQQKHDWFSQPLGLSRMNSRIQQQKHNWISEPQGNGWKWSWSS